MRKLHNICFHSNLPKLNYPLATRYQCQQQAPHPTRKTKIKNQKSNNSSNSSKQTQTQTINLFDLFPCKNNVPYPHHHTTQHLQQPNPQISKCDPHGIQSISDARNLDSHSRIWGGKYHRKPWIPFPSPRGRASFFDIIPWPYFPVPLVPVVSVPLPLPVVYSVLFALPTSGLPCRCCRCCRILKVAWCTMFEFAAESSIVSYNGCSFWTGMTKWGAAILRRREIDSVCW